MPKVDFRQHVEREKPRLLPDGVYRVEVAHVDEDVSRSGDDLLRLRLRVLEGEHAGAFLFDRISFSKRALPRLRLILEAFGIAVDGEVNITPELLEGRRCLVDVLAETYTRSDGSEGRGNGIPFAGYHKADEGAEALAPY